MCLLRLPAYLHYFRGEISIEFYNRFVHHRLREVLRFDMNSTPAHIFTSKSI